MTTFVHMRESRIKPSAHVIGSARNSHAGSQSLPTTASPSRYGKGKAAVQSWGRRFSRQQRLIG